MNALVIRVASMVIMAAVVTACGGSSGRVASSSPSAPLVSVPSSSTPPSPSPPTPSVTCTAKGARLALTAHHEKFSADCLAVKGGEAFTIAFDNKDKLSHNVSILTSTGAPVFDGDIVEGPDSTTYKVQALAPGTYIFHCDVHPQIMRGTLIVAG